MKKLVLIDGNAIMHRAFHAMPPFTTGDGRTVNAVYGFFSMFLKIIGDLKPDYLIVCFDRPAPTFRKQMYVGYQAKRPQMAEGLSPQFGITQEVLRKAGVSMFSVDGYEADDLIGTIAAQAVKKDDRRLKIEDSNLSVENRKSIHPQSSSFKNLPSSVDHLSSNIEVIIVSGDRDLLQLVNDHVTMMAPVTGITNMLLYDEKKVEEKFGIKPSQIIDYKALVGDSSDNYPGVSGIGPKTAVELLKKYETFENLYEHIAQLPEKVSTKLATDAEQAALCKKLATIILDVPIKLELTSCTMVTFDQDSLAESFIELEFVSLLKRMGTPVEVEKKVLPPKIVSRPKDEQLELL